MSAWPKTGMDLVNALKLPELYAELTKKYLEPDIRHQWYIKGMSKEQLEKIRKYSEERYGKGGGAAK